MIKKVIHLADIHIRPYQRLEEYTNKLNDLKENIKGLIDSYDKEEVRIVISGDIVHSKNQISNELIAFVSSWIRELEDFGRVIVISGNHDLVVDNKSRIDTLTAIFTAANFQNSIHLDSYLGYDSGIIVEDNVTWALYSIFTDYKRPNIEQAKEDYPNNIVIGLYHGTVVGATLNNGTVMDSGTSGDEFEGCDFVMAGDIHKRQVIKRGDCEIVYPGSLIQQTFGETVTQHGFAVWDLEKKTYEFVDLPLDYELYDFEIKSPEDLDENKEILINY
jgi:DNA repair exonuclease SbcCD nuclease subunit